MIGLPSLHALDTAQSMRIWLAAEAIDMRRGFDRLAEHARTVIGADPLGNKLWEVVSTHLQVDTTCVKSWISMVSVIFWPPCLGSA